jgi:hypothetical protein
MKTIVSQFASIPASAKSSYDAYYSFTEKLVAEGKTTGTDQSPAMLEYTRLNLHRMKKWNKVGQLNEEVVSATQKAQKQTWYVLTEPWCGDASQSVPFLAKMAEASNGNIELVLLLRDENIELMNHYLTNGTRSIPKLVAVGNSGEELFAWGPRPVAAQDLMMRMKEDASLSAEDKKEKLHKWYADNKGQDIQKEIIALLKQ